MTFGKDKNATILNSNPLPMQPSPKHSKDIQSQFRYYLINIAQTRGRHYSFNTIDSYTSAINNICKEEQLSS